MEARKLQKKYTISDYEKWEGDWELWDGVPVQLYPPHPEEMTGFKDGMLMSPSPIAPHQIVVSNMIRTIGNALEAVDGCECLVVGELDWQVSETCVVRPDISVVCPPLETRYIERPPQLVVETLSPSTIDRDLKWKRDLYQQRGVGVYLIVDVKRRDVEALGLEADGYRPGRVDEIAVHEGCRIQLDVERFWKSLPPK